MPNYTLRQSRTGYWEVRWSEKTGTRYTSRSVSTRTKDRRAAEAFRDQWAAIAAQQAASGSEPEFADLVDQYLLAARRGPTQEICCKHLVRFFGKHRASEIDDDMLRSYRAQRAVKPGTLRRELGVFNAVLNHAARKKRIDPGHIPHVDLPPPSEAREVHLSHAQEVQFMAKLQEDRVLLPNMYLFSLIALRTGARKGAIEGLDWSQVDVPGRQIDFRRPGASRTKKRRVPVPVDDMLQPVLQDWPSRADSGPVFPRPIRSEFEKFVSRHPEFSHATPHVLRHTAATRWLREGISIWNVAGLLGDTVETTTRVYGHHATADLRAAMSGGK